MKMDAKIYWKKNLKYLAVLLSIWAFVSFGCGIFFVDQLDTIRIGGFKLGFCPTGIHVRFCSVDICLCIPDEQIGQTN